MSQVGTFATDYSSPGVLGTNVRALTFNTSGFSFVWRHTWYGLHDYGCAYCYAIPDIGWGNQAAPTGGFWGSGGVADCTFNRTSGPYYTDWVNTAPQAGEIQTRTLYQRSITALTGGTVSATGGTVSPNEGRWSVNTVTGTPSASSGKRFKEWRYANGTAVTSKTGLTVATTITMTTALFEDISVYAYFIDTTVPFTITPNTGGAVSAWVDGVSKSTSSTLDTTATYTVRVLATPSSAYNFVGWYTAANGAGTQVSTSADYTFTYDATSAGPAHPPNGSTGVVLYAYFKEKTDIIVTTSILLDSVPEVSEFDGNAFSLYTETPLKAGENKFNLFYNSDHFWGKPTLTVSEKTKVTGTDYNVVTLGPEGYTIDLDGRITLNLAPLQSWTSEEDPIAFGISADFPANPVGATVIAGVNSGTYSWMYAVQFTDWDGRGYTTPEDEPNRPMNPLYGDTGTVTITPIDGTKIKIAHVTVKYGENTAIDEDTTGANDTSFEFEAAVTGAITITVSMKATVTVSGGSSVLPEGVTFTINSTEEVDNTANVIVGAPCSLDYTGEAAGLVFNGWTLNGYQTYVSGTPSAMVTKKEQSAAIPFLFTPNGNTIIVPAFVEADATPFVAVQFFNATTTSLFTPGGSNPTLAYSGGNTSTYSAMIAQVMGLAGGNFADVFAISGAPAGSSIFISLASLATLSMTANGTTALPFLRFEKAEITKGDGATEDCVIGDWSAVTPILNPISDRIIVSCAYRAVFGAYQPQQNSAAFANSTMRAMGAITVTGYSTTTASDGKVTATTGYGDSVTWSAAPFVGYKFSGWYTASSGGTLVSTSSDYTIEQDSVSRTYYAVFVQDTTRLYLMEGGPTRKTAYWKSKRYELQRPTSFSACRVDAYGYPVQLQTHAFSSPSSVSATTTGIVICEDQDCRRIPSMRKERFVEFSVETLYPVVGMSFSTTMQGLS